MTIAAVVGISVVDESRRRTSSYTIKDTVPRMPNSDLP